MRLVIIESPYMGDVDANVAYARRCVRDCLMRGEAPMASHLLYTQPGVLSDGVPVERSLGIDAGLAWGKVAEATVVYTDRGISDGMRLGIEAAAGERRLVEYREIDEGAAVTKAAAPSMREALVDADGYLEADDAEERPDPGNIRRRLRDKIRAALSPLPGPAQQ